MLEISFYHPLFLYVTPAEQLGKAVDLCASDERGIRFSCSRPLEILTDAIRVVCGLAANTRLKLLHESHTLTPVVYRCKGRAVAKAVPNAPLAICM